MNKTLFILLSFLVIPPLVIIGGQRIEKNFTLLKSIEDPNNYFFIHYSAPYEPLKFAFTDLLIPLQIQEKKSYPLENNPFLHIPKNAQLQKFKFINPYETMGVTWGNCAQKKKGFYIFYQSDKKNPNQLELRGFVSLKTEGTIDVSGIMLTGKLNRIWLIPNFFMDFSFTAKPGFSDQIKPITFGSPKVETSLKVSY